MSGKLTTAVLLMLGLCACGAGCLPSWWGGRQHKVAQKVTMSAPEARRTIARARARLYSETAADYDLAVRLADSVINTCNTPRYVWEGFFVKATAYQAAGDAGRAQRAAHEGIQTILISGRGALRHDALTALKMLLPVYVECAIAGPAREQGLKALRLWKDELHHRLGKARAPDPAAAEAINAEFELLEQMAEQYLGARKPESQVQGVVQQYIDHFNTKNTPGLAKLFARGLAQAGAWTLPADHLYLGSAVKVEISDDNGPAKQATAVCDLLATSAAGWARVIPSVRFRFTKDASGQWLILEIVSPP